MIQLISTSHDSYTPNQITIKDGNRSIIDIAYKGLFHTREYEVKGVDFV